MMFERRRSHVRSSSTHIARNRGMSIVGGVMVFLLLANLQAAALAQQVPPVGDTPSVDDTVDDAADQVGDAVDAATGGNGGGGDGPAADASADADVQIDIGGDGGPSQGGGSPAATTPAPATSGSSGSDSSVAEVDAGDGSIAGVGQTEANNGNGNSNSSASSLSALGHEATGTESSSSGASSSQASSGLAAHAVCGITEGSVCVGLLYEEAASDSGGARADGVLVGACLGGQGDPAEACRGPIGLTIGQSSSSVAGYSSTLVGACFGSRSATTASCNGIGATVLSADETAGGERNEIGASLEVGGRQLLAIGHPDAIPDCSAFPNSCITFNDGNVRQADSGPSSGGSGGSGPASASADGAVIKIALGERNMAGVSETGAAADGSGSSSDATVVSVLGHEVIGAHATAENGSSQSETGYLTESCEASDGRICAALLYGQATASADGDGSRGSSDSAVASACLFGDQRDPTEPCDGPVGAAALESHSDASADNDPGSASSDQWSNVGDVCVGGEDDSEKCTGVGAEIIHSESHSDAATDSPAASDADSSLADVEMAGDDAVSVDGEGEIPPDCTDGAALACVVLNNAATDAAAGFTSGSATAATLELLRSSAGSEALLGGGIGDSSTGAGTTSDGDDSGTPGEFGPEDPDTDDPAAPGDEPNGDQPGDENSNDDDAGAGGEVDGEGASAPGGEVAGADASATGGSVAGAAKAPSGVAGEQLPFTGGNSTLPVAAGLILIALGVLVWAMAAMARTREH